MNFRPQETIFVQGTESLSLRNLGLELVNASIHLLFLEDHLTIRLGSLVTDRSGSLPWFLNLGMDQNWVPQELDG